MDARDERDEWLMAQVALGRRESLEPLVRRYAQSLLSFIHRVIPDWHRSEELFQEVFLAVWLKRAQYQFPRPFKPWLYAIALNRCRATLRSTRSAFVPLDDEPPLPGDDSPADLAIATETAARVARAVRQLPARQRAVVVLRVWDGLSYREIAEVVGRTEATVRSHMHHGLIALRRVLEPSVSG